VTNEIDRRGNSNTSTYYADGRLQSITDAAGNTTQYAYDTTTNTTTVRDADGGTITTVADAYGSPLSVTRSAQPDHGLHLRRQPRHC